MRTTKIVHTAHNEDQLNSAIAEIYRARGIVSATRTPLRALQQLADARLRFKNLGIRFDEAECDRQLASLEEDIVFIVSKS